MKIQSATRSALFLGALLLSGASQAVTVNFSGTLDAYNTGPFAAGDAFSGSFELDKSVVPTGTSSATYTGVVDNFMLDVAGNAFSGQNGTVHQTPSTGGGTDYFSLTLGGSYGTISGSVGTNAIQTFSVDWRGPALFPDPTVLAHDLTTGDFGYRRIVLDFFDSASAIDNASEISFGSVAVVPVPAAVWLFGSGLVGLIGMARRRKAT